jgi:hypothetical protein
MKKGNLEAAIHELFINSHNLLGTKEISHNSSDIQTSCTIMQHWLLVTNKMKIVYGKNIVPLL